MNEAIASHGVLDLVSQAGPVVKLVMLSLMMSSVVSWAIIFDKWRRFRQIARESEAFEERFWSGGSVGKLYQTAADEWPGSPMVAVFLAGFREWKRWEGGGGTAARDPEVGDLLTNVRRSMTVTLNREMDNIGQGLTFLATVGSTSPFIGLFGTVWGIMNSFRGLAGAKTTTLTMVAPGIAEALIATAMGLVAAIPAVIAYNKYAADLRRMQQSMDNFGAEFLNILERQAARRLGRTTS
ncbi:MAG: protein TolQ [Magnetococcales bacterium]|nr:protein TolQ [Magnetococcales bacterium]MBF0151816.1 protein TolQ [Magnetococcales bacterium]MBF0174583.1 protein TolQ [Magnetococcales bacterium]MBF0346746.1 protein TolQ [Magnetococcales bacterium]MBF0630371.1 protein TolQ [Magnetococcales bacterium]